MRWWDPLRLTESKFTGRRVVATLALLAAVMTIAALMLR